MRLTWSKEKSKAVLSFIAGAVGAACGVGAGGGTLKLNRKLDGGSDERTILQLDEPLPTGTTIRIVLKLRLSQTDGSALSELFIDGVKKASSTIANVSPGTIDGALPRFNSVRFGFDGAHAQDSSAIRLRMGRIDTNLWPPSMVP